MNSLTGKTKRKGGTSADATGADGVSENKDSICTCPFCGRSFPSEKSVSKAESQTVAIPYHCLKCGHSWKSINALPSVCPKCRSRTWQRSDLHCRCLRCGHEWISKRDAVPSRCPKCRSGKWNDNTVSKKGRKKKEEPGTFDISFSDSKTLTMEDIFRISTEGDKAVFTVLREAVKAGLIRTEEGDRK